MTVFRDPYALPIAMDGVSVERRQGPVAYDRDSYAIALPDCLRRPPPRYSTAQDEQAKGPIMTPEKHELAIRYLMERMAPEDQRELKSLLGEEEMPTVAEDALYGRRGLSMDALPDRMRRQAVAVAGLRHKPVRTAEEDAMFPNAGRLSR